MQKQYKSSIYLEHNATTPVAPESLKAMMPYLQENFGNPSSEYILGKNIKEGRSSGPGMM